MTWVNFFDTSNAGAPIYSRMLEQVPRADEVVKIEGVRYVVEDVEWEYLPNAFKGVNVYLSRVEGE